MTDVPVIAYVGVGANLEQPRRQVEQAIDALRALPDTQVVACSGLYVSAPVDAPGPDYVNAVVALRTSFDAGALLQLLHGIEARFGRERSARNAPRTLDLDLLLHGNTRSDGPSLRLPHPRLHLRAFVLRPLLEIAPALDVKGLGPLSAYLERVQDQPIRRVESER